MQNKEYPQDKSNQNIKAWWSPALILFGKFSGWILFPLIIGYTLGKWLDAKNNSEPLFFLVTIGVSFFISMYGLIKNTLSEYKKIEKESSSSKAQPLITKDKQQNKF